MPIPALSDVRINVLVEIFSAANKHLLIHFSDLEKIEKRKDALGKIQKILKDLKNAAFGWAASQLPKFYAEEDVWQLSKNQLPISELNGDVVEPIIATMKWEIERALLSIRVAALRVRAGDIGTDKIKGLVSIIGKSGRSFSFDLPYYVALVAQSSQRRCVLAAVLQRSRIMNLDLIRISSDFRNYDSACNLYSGKVFSLSGNSNAAPALSSIPELPFHPFCLKKFELYLEDSPPDNNEVPSWAFLSGPNDSFSKVVARYLQHEKEFV